MSADIEINPDGNYSMDITVSVNSIRIKTYNKYTYFDMTNETDRQAVKNLVEVLQQQLEVHGVE